MAPISVHLDGHIAGDSQKLKLITNRNRLAIGVTRRDEPVAEEFLLDASQARALANMLFAMSDYVEKLGSPDSLRGAT
jgi:hypothetical protein